MNLNQNDRSGNTIQISSWCSIAIGFISTLCRLLHQEFSVEQSNGVVAWSVSLWSREKLCRFFPEQVATQSR
jgi:hypothetical protein